MEDAIASIGIKSELSSVVNYALLQNKTAIVKEISVRNNSAEPMRNLKIKISSRPQIILDFQQNIDYIAPNAEVLLKQLDIKLDIEQLASLTEKVDGSVIISVISEQDELLESEYHDVTFLAFDEWQGALYYPEILASFVTPNHPQVSLIVANASKLLTEWKSDPSLNAYQTNNPNRVLLQVAAVYGALQKENIVYSVPPASFEVIGQRVRLCDAVMEQKIGCCLDLTLLYAACLEAIGLHPLLLLKKGHIFAGLWLEDMTFSETIQDDPSLVSKKIADGVNEIAIVECTALVSGKNISFDDARQMALSELNGDEPLMFLIDVTRARMSGIRPLPLRKKTDSGFQVEMDLRKDEDITVAPSVVSVVNINENTSGGAPEGKLSVWERKLLDLSLRNSLINLRLTQSAVPVLSQSLNDLENALSGGDKFQILSKPSEIELPDNVEFESLANLNQYGALLSSEFQKKRLRTSLSEAELTKAIIALHRSSKVSLEENGANTLYLALGLMRWYESDVSEKPRYAPIILMPVDLIRKSANKGYVIRLRDDEIQMNITLLEKLKRDFGISISGLDTLPQDECGVDIKGVFTILRRAIMNQQRWDITEASLLGLFTFSQFVMWNDIRNRTDDLMKNKIVRSFVEGKLTWTPQATAMGEEVPEEDVLMPMPADASQLHAIRLAMSDESFVLHGPPGTGKSQTITAIISNALARGKTVLFVAEKMAALSVVQNRLEKIGLGPFCLEVHSNKAKKSDVLEQLRITSELKKALPELNYNARAEQIERQRKELDVYAKALHKKQAFGLSVFDAVNEYEKVEKSPDLIRFPKETADKCSADFLEKQNASAEQLIAAAKSVGHPQNHPLERVACADYSLSLKSELPTMTEDYRQTITEMKVKSDGLSNELALSPADKFSELHHLNAIAAQLQVWFPMPRAWASYSSFAITDSQGNQRHSLDALGNMAGHFLKATEIRQALSQGWNQEFLTLDGKSLKTRWSEACTKWFLPKLFAQKKIIKELAPYSISAVNVDTLGNILTQLFDYQNEISAANALFGAYGAELGELNQGDGTDWSRIQAFAQQAKQSYAALKELTGSDELKEKFAAEKSLFPVVTEYLQAYEKAMANRSKLYETLNITADDSISADNDIQLCGSIDANIDSFKEWTVWNSVCKNGIDLGLEPLISAYKNGLGHETAYCCYKKAIYKMLINDAVDKTSELNGFSGTIFNEKIEQFKKLDNEISELSKQEVFCRLAAKIPDFTAEASANSEVGILQRAIRGKGRGISIRKLFEQIPNLLPRICPCLLMSPMSAAQYLDPKSSMFDLVVFDEASQMPTARAIGAIARGKNAVIVGDPKQMPPTSFFASANTDEDNFEMEDLESILDDCLALNMPQSYLLWHYRSRHESLIAFSNSKFYENKLYTFPSVNDRASKVSLIEVNGNFERGKSRQNKEEAKAVVDEVIRRFHDESLKQKSIGIVTFNIQQQNLIDDMLSTACGQDSALDNWVFQSKEPLFIKNLENVQGDERDVILFSVGYGPDRDGNFFMNFGPLNREGGWRRLNVAVSRARDEMMVFSSVPSDMINLARTSAEGVAALKAFLEYAKVGKLPMNKDAAEIEKSAECSVVDSICSFLQENGFETVKSVGKSGYRVDVGIINPTNRDEYLLGILLDGSSYKNAKTTRDREIAQISVLSGLGWETYRVWTMDWWENSRKTLDGILSHLKEIESRPKQEKTEEKPVETIPSISEKLEAQVVTQTATPKNIYKSAVLPVRKISSDELVLPANTAVLKSAITQVLNAESPICDSVLFKRVIQGFGLSRMGTKVQARIQQLLGAPGINSAQFGTQTVYWTGSNSPDDYSDFRINGDDDNKRDVTEIPVFEVANAVCKILTEQIGLPKDSLIRENANLFGFSRLGNSVISSMSDGIEYAKQKQLICESSSDYFTMPK